MLTIEKNNFILALSKELESEWLRVRNSASGEWDKYISYFSYLVLEKMWSRNRVKMYVLDDKKKIAILRCFSDEMIRKRVKKDLHLVLTALEADKRLISGNTRDRKHFQSACSKVYFLADILWPAALEEVVPWLKRGAPEKPQHFLCPRAGK